MSDRKELYLAGITFRENGKTVIHDSRIKKLKMGSQKKELKKFYDQENYIIIGDNERIELAQEDMASLLCWMFPEESTVSMITSKGIKLAVLSAAAIAALVSAPIAIPAISALALGGTSALAIGAGATTAVATTAGAGALAGTTAVVTSSSILVAQVAGIATVAGAATVGVVKNNKEDIKKTNRF